jgi:hypothetical protein
MIHGDEARDAGEDLFFDEPAHFVGRLPAAVSVDKGYDFGGSQLRPAGIRRKGVEPVRDREQASGFPTVGVHLLGGQGKDGLIRVGKNFPLVYRSELLLQSIVAFVAVQKTSEKNHFFIQGVLQGVQIF